MEVENNNLNKQESKLNYKILTSDEILEGRGSEINEIINSTEEEIESKVVKNKISQRLKFQTLSSNNQSLKQFFEIRSYFLIIVSIIILVSLTILFKPHRKILSLLVSNELQKEKKTSETAPAIIFPSTTENDQLLIVPTTSQIVSSIVSTSSETTTTNISTTTNVSTTPNVSTTINILTTTNALATTNTSTTEKTIVLTSTEMNTTTAFQSSDVTNKSLQNSNLNYPLPQKELSFIDNLFLLRETIAIDDLNQNVFNSYLNSFLRKQEQFGTKVYVDFTYNGKKIPYNFIFNYFFESSKVNFQELKDNFTGNYAFLLLYGYTRKYPMLIFEVNKPQDVENFNAKWEKTSMANDLKTLFLDSAPSKINGKFISKIYKNYSYRILDLSNNYKIIWTVIDKYLIYSTTETGLKEIIDNF